MSAPAAVRHGTLVVRARQVEACSLEELARDAGMHPDLVRRLARLGVIEPLLPGSDLWARAGAARLARAVRLRRDLGLNYAGAVLVAELVDRIDELERRLRRHEEARWIRPS